MGADSYSSPTPVVYCNPTATMTPSSDHQAANSSTIDATINVLEARIRQLESQVAQAAAADTPAPCRKNTLTGEIKLAVSCNIVSLSNINTADESFQAEIMVRACTLNAKDLQVVIRGVDNYADRSGACEDITVDNWEPRLSFNNLTETATWKMSPKSLGDGELSFKVSSVSIVHGSVNIVHGSVNIVHGSVSIVHGSVSIVHGSVNIVHGSVNIVHGSVSAM